MKRLPIAVDRPRLTSCCLLAPFRSLAAPIRPPRAHWVAFNTEVADEHQTPMSCSLIFSRLLPGFSKSVGSHHLCHRRRAELTLTAHARTDRLVADAEVGSERSQTFSPGKGADGRLLICAQLQWARLTAGITPRRADTAALGDPRDPDGVRCNQGARCASTRANPVASARIPGRLTRKRPVEWQQIRSWPLGYGVLFAIGASLNVCSYCRLPCCRFCSNPRRRALTVHGA
jgi:hypothetical protein